jgi:hypothetical protein
MDDSAEGADVLLALQEIQHVGDRTPFHIKLLSFRQGTAAPVEEMMAAKVKWAEKVGYRTLTRDIPPEFYPYNAVIRMNERNTEDRNLDYLARMGVGVLVNGTPSGQRPRGRT